VDEPGAWPPVWRSSRDYRPAIEHPPFTRLWAALPLLFMSGVSFDTRAVDSARPEVVAFRVPDIGHRL
jgi:hypothetical protein